jgi:outer membrane receptor protein involved in Fe transport
LKTKMLTIVTQKLTKMAFLRLPTLLLLLPLMIDHGFAHNPSIQSQGGVNGVVIDSATHQPIAFATVALLAASGEIVVGQTTSESGSFAFLNIPYGVYNLRVSFLGYQTRTLSGLSITNQDALSLGLLTIVRQSQQLGEVVITGQKSIVEEKADRLVYNAADDLTNKGGTAVDVLRKAPMLTVDMEGNVLLRGSSSLRVLLNGRPSGMLARNLSEALKMIPANTIQSVEVMTSPPARYDAEGAAGVINIITKKQLRGSSGNVDITAGDYTQSLGGQYAVKREKFGLAMSANVNSERRKTISEVSQITLLNGQPTGELFQRRSIDNRNRGWFGDLSMDYAFDTLNRISVSMSTWGGVWPGDRSIYYQFRTLEGQPTKAFTQEIDEKSPFGNIEFNSGYTRSFRKPKQELTILAQYSYTYDRTEYTSDQFAPDGGALYHETSYNRSRNPQQTVQLDYTHPLSPSGRHLIEFGIKAQQRNVGSRYTVHASRPAAVDDLIHQADRSNVFDYDQQVLAAYGSLRLTSSNQWTLQAGARQESTVMGGTFAHSIPPFRIRFGNLIPSVIIGKQLDDLQSIKASYTQRMTRPMIWDLNPYVDASDPNNLRAGNPLLRPEITHLGEVAYSITTKGGAYMNLALYRRQTGNSIQEVRTVDTLGVAQMIKENIARNQRTGINVTTAWEQYRNWKFNGSGEFYYAQFNSSALQVKNSGWLWQISLNTAYQLPAGYSLQAYGLYSSGWILLQGKNTSWIAYSLAARKEFWNKKGSLVLGINNPFTMPYQQNNLSQSNTFRAYSENRYYMRSVKLTFSWQFGQIRSGSPIRQKKITNEDIKAK